jgi:glycosyltransferase involved in cell wall biosynthesis
MAAGRPIVATNVGGNAELLVDGVSGLLVPPRDPGALAGAVLRVVRDPGLASRLGAAARQRVEAEFSLATMMGRLERLYDDLLANGHHAA